MTNNVIEWKNERLVKSYFTCYKYFALTNGTQVKLNPLKKKYEFGL